MNLQLSGAFFAPRHCQPFCCTLLDYQWIRKPLGCHSPGDIQACSALSLEFFSRQSTAD